MLYVTTREQHDAFTTARAIAGNRGEDGGFYLPFRIPFFDTETIESIVQKSYCACMAEILNLFFSCGFSAWDVEFATGRYPVQVESLQQKIYVGEIWQKQEMTYKSLATALNARISPNSTEVVSWIRIAIGIGNLFALYGVFRQKEILSAGEVFDVALDATDFDSAMAVWYARKMGLPVGTIVCGCDESSGLWDLLHFGEVKCASDGNGTLPAEVERLIFSTLGYEEVQRFLHISKASGLYSLEEDAFAQLRSGLFASVVSEGRMLSVIPNVYRTCEYVLNPRSALAYSALLDYRTKEGEGRSAVVLSHSNPICDEKVVASAMSVKPDELRRILNLL